MSANKLTAGVLVVNLALAVGLITYNISDSDEHKLKPKDDVEHMQTSSAMFDRYKAEEAGDYEQFIASPRIAGNEVLNIINESVIRDLTVFVVNRENPTVANVYGVGLGEHTQPTYNVASLFTEGKASQLPLLNSRKITDKVIGRALANIAVYQTFEGLDNLEQPALNFYHDHNGIRPRLFLADYDKGEPIVDTQPTGDIELTSRYFSTLILNKESKVTGIYFEEAGLPYADAFLGNILLYQHHLDELPEYEEATLYEE